MRQPLRNAFAQTDVDMKDFILRNAGGIDSPEGNTIYVDGSLPVDQGNVGSSLAFQSIGTAVQLAPPGTLIVVRPGTYAYDGQIIMKRAGVRIVGYGAIITPLTPANATGFLVTANFCTIEGFEFDGGIAPGDSDDIDGAPLQIGGASNLTIRNCNIHDFNTHGIFLVDRFPGIMIDNCRISGCNTAITSPGLITQAISGVNIKNCTITSNRNEGVRLAGVDNAGGVIIRDIRIMNNEFVSNDTAGQSKAAINIDHGGSTVLVKGNWIFDHYDGLNMVKVKDAHVNGNIFQAQRHNQINVTGEIVLEIAGNTFEGANVSTGNPLTVGGIGISGDYASANDSGPIHIIGNLFNAHTGNPVSVSNANDVVVTANNFKGASGVIFTDLTNLRLTANDFSMSGTNVAVSLVATARGMQGISVKGNTFFTTGSPTKLLATNNANSLTFDDVRYVGNVSPVGKTYSGGIINHISGAVPTNVSIVSNVPASIVVSSGSFDSRNGWVNDGQTALASKELDIARGSASEKVIGAAHTGWDVPTGTFDRTTFSPYAAATISNPPTQAEVQAIATNLQTAMRRLAPLISDLHASGGSSTHGLLRT